MILDLDFCFGFFVSVMKQTMVVRFYSFGKEIM